jgi:hypothetical protein
MMYEQTRSVRLRANKRVGWWRASAALLLMASAAARPVHPTPMTPIELTDTLGIACLDGKGQIQRIEDESSYPATLASLKQTWAAFGHAFQAYQIDDKTGLLRFSDSQPPPDRYEYTIKLSRGSLVVVGLAIHQNHTVQHVAGTEACIQLFDLFHRQS